MARHPWPRSEASAILSGGYPSFIYGGAYREGTYLPVFVFHTLDPKGFDAGLRYLQENGYVSVTLDRAVAWMRGTADLPERAVVLTVDDGRLTTWTVGLPLLEARAMVATAFVIPGYLGEGPPRPVLDPARTGDPDPELCPPEEVDRRVHLRWSEVEALHASGVVAVESHTMLHRRVEVSARLEGFLDPVRLKKAPYLVPLPAGRRTAWDGDELERRLGAPLFESVPLLAARERHLPADGQVRACVEEVARAGSAGFFRRAGWEGRLREVVHAPTEASDGTRESLLDEQVWELEVSKRTLEARLPGKRVRHLALPEGAGCDDTAGLARRCGYESCLWAYLPASETNRPGATPFRIGRLKSDYLFSLPGRRRHSLPRVLLHKSLRRMRGRTGF